jgi:hypothetical protein
MYKQLVAGVNPLSGVIFFLVNWDGKAKLDYKQSLPMNLS